MILSVHYIGLVIIIIYMNIWVCVSRYRCFGFQCVNIKNDHTHTPCTCPFISLVQSLSLSLLGSSRRCWLPNNFGFEFKCAFIIFTSTHTRCPLLTFRVFLPYIVSSCCCCHAINFQIHFPCLPARMVAIFHFHFLFSCPAYMKCN